MQVHLLLWCKVERNAGASCDRDALGLRVEAASAKLKEAREQQPDAELAILIARGGARRDISKVGSG